MVTDSLVVLASMPNSPFERGFVVSLQIISGSLPQARSPGWASPHNNGFGLKSILGRFHVTGHHVVRIAGRDQVFVDVDAF